MSDVDRAIRSLPRTWSGAEIRDTRRSLGLTKGDLAELCTCSASGIAQAEEGGCEGLRLKATWVLLLWPTSETVIDRHQVLRQDRELPKDPWSLAKLIDRTNQLDEALDDRAIQEWNREHLGRALLGLAYRERRILEMYYGLGTEEPRTFEYIALRLNLTPRRVDKIHRAVLAKLSQPDRCPELREAVL